MTELKRYTFMCRDGNQLCILELPDIVTGGWVAAADYEAKCADYERLREALEKLQEGLLFGATNEERLQIVREALTPPPAAGIPEEADAGVAARKSEESSSGGRK